MRGFTVSVRKLTDVDLMHEACESTFIGKSNASLLSIYKTEHSPVRTQLFWVTLKDIPLFVSTHLLRHHVGSVPFQLSCRSDRKGGTPGMIDKCNAIIEKLKQACSKCNGDMERATSLIFESTQEIEWLRDNADRYTPVTLSLLLNAQSLIDMSKLRLCNQASQETRIVFQAIKDEIAKIDPDLAKVMVRKCVYRCGICGEQRCCGYNNTANFKAELKDYVSLLTEKQRGITESLVTD